MAFFPKILYFVIIAICVLAIVTTYVSRKKGGFKDGTRRMTVILAFFCGVFVSVVYFVENRTLSGSYAVYLSFAVSPLFLHRMFGGGRLKLMCPVVVSFMVIVWAVCSFSGVALWNLDRWLPPLMTAMLLVLIGSTIWRLTDRQGRFDAVAVCREWMISLSDILYYAALVFISSVGLGMGAGSVANYVFLVSFLVGLLAAMWLRLRNGRAFLILTSKEDSFLGNVNRSSKAAYIGNVECGLSGEELFSSLKDYFDKKMPYLNPGLTLTDVAKYLVTNKVYLSRAINDFTGQNFCQFVNLYRVKYAIRLFNCNSAYKVSDLAVKSGFNCERSFIMAFRLYMNTSPSRWCKQNREKRVGKVLRN